MLITKALSLEMAKIMADAAVAKAKENSSQIVIAIMDNHGNLKYYRRMDESNFVAIRIAMSKAYTCASVPLSTKDLAARNVKLEGLPYFSAPDIILLEGGLPIVTKDEKHIGAIGISGSTGEIDAACAEAAIDAIKHML